MEGYTLQGTGTGIGVDLTERHYVTVRNMKIKDFSHGIYIYYDRNSADVGGIVRSNKIYANSNARGINDGIYTCCSCIFGKAQA